jgi:catechol 2,3-dioxygenase-like lactoylglutathione lyase family enzyme
MKQQAEPAATLEATGAVTFLPTDDLEATDAFYRGLLGLELVRDQGVCRIYRASHGSGQPNGGGYWGFCNRGYTAPAEVRIVLTLLVADPEAAHAELLTRGLTPEGPPQHYPNYAVTSFFVRDPNGYLIEFQRFDVPIR